MLQGKLWLIWFFADGQFRSMKRAVAPICGGTLGDLANSVRIIDSEEHCKAHQDFFSVRVNSPLTTASGWLIFSCKGQIQLKDDDEASLN